LSRITHRLVQLLALCGAGGAILTTSEAGAPEVKAAQDSNREARWATERAEMVRSQIATRDIRDPRVLEAMREVPRHRFVPLDYRDRAYHDRPLPIGLGQTISQPYIVAAMTEFLRPEATDRVLEIGTGSGYQAAVVSRLVAKVYSIEIVPELAERAAKTLAELGYANVEVSSGDGYRGIPSEAPFDGILVTAAPDEIPEPLIEQLAVGGRMVIPVGDFYQQLTVVEKTERGITKRAVFPVRFVPMTGEATR
jgi:protein-L-isoaspartate(D-aspartate) O-methyltransferase